MLRSRSPIHPYTLGVAGVLIAALCASSAGILLRHVDAADGWQILFYRSIAFTLMLLLVIVARHRSRTAAAFRAIGVPGLVVALGLGGAFIAFIFSMLMTTVANAVFILSAAPFFGALMGWIVLREPVARRTWLGIAAAVAGVAIMMADGLTLGSGLGSLMALLAGLGYAAAIVALRAGKSVDMMPATCLAGAVAFLVCLLLVDELVISRHDLVIALLLGTAQIGLQYLLITLSSRVVPAAQITLLMLSEVVLAPLWVWIGVGEAPSPATLLGGAVVVAAIILPAVRGLRQPAPA